VSVVLVVSCAAATPAHARAGTVSSAVKRCIRIGSPGAGYAGHTRIALAGSSRRL